MPKNEVNLPGPTKNLFRNHFHKADNKKNKNNGKISPGLAEPDNNNV